MKGKCEAEAPTIIMPNNLTTINHFPRSWLLASKKFPRNFYKEEGFQDLHQGSGDHGECRMLKKLMEEGFRYSVYYYSICI